MILVGLGKVGFKGFPETHYQLAIRNNLEVIAGIDPSFEAREKFSRETGVPSYQSLSDLKAEDWFSFFSVASSSDSSFEILSTILSRKGPKGILVEKPFCKNSAESEVVMNLQARSKIPLRVNYLRQYSQAMKDLISFVANKNFVSGVVIYSSGLRENGSHFIRLICGLFQSIITPESVEWFDGARFRVKFGNSKYIDFVPLESPYLHNSEIKLIFEGYLLSISEGLVVEIREIDSMSPIRKWPRESNLFLKTDFADGFEASFLNQNWWRFPNQDNLKNELALDHLCNLIIEKASKEKNIELEGFNHGTC